jgi:hypothetical protein
MTGFETFGLYESLKLHFSKDSYDFFKYNGKTNHSVQTFENRKDKYFFYKLSRKFNNKDEMVDFLVANFLEDDKVWVGKLLDEQSEDVYRKRLKVIQSLSYTFENDCRNLFDGIENPNDLIHTDGDYPILLTKVLRKEISIETFVILSKILGFLPMWDKKISDTIRYPEFARKVRKYAAFMQADVVKYKLILKKVIGV